MTINEMKNEVIRTFGRDHVSTRYFMNECAHTNDIALLRIVFAFTMLAGRER